MREPLEAVLFVQFLIAPHERFLTCLACLIQVLSATAETNHPQVVTTKGKLQLKGMSGGFGILWGRMQPALLASRSKHLMQAVTASSCQTSRIPYGRGSLKPEEETSWIAIYYQLGIRLNGRIIHHRWEVLNGTIHHQSWKHNNGKFIDSQSPT